MDFVNFSGCLTLVLLVFLSCVIETFPVSNVTLFSILCFGVSLMLSMLLYLGISGDDALRPSPIHGHTHSNRRSIQTSQNCSHHCRLVVF